MIISKNAVDVAVQGEQLHSSGKMHINIDNSSALIRMLTKAYADPVGSLIRESVANAKDSQIDLFTIILKRNIVILHITNELNL